MQGERLPNQLQPPKGIEIKCVIIGDGAIGKTCLLLRFTRGTFDDGYIPTVFDNFELPFTRGEKSYRLCLYDTAGQEDYANLRCVFYCKADVFLLCFSVASKISFENVEKWKRDVTQIAPSAKIILVGCQTDRRVQEPGTVRTMGRQIVFPREAMEMAKRINAVCYIECSAKTGAGVAEVFDTAIQAVCGTVSRRKRCQIL